MVEMMKIISKTGHRLPKHGIGFISTIKLYKTPKTRWIHLNIRIPTPTKHLNITAVGQGKGALDGKNPCPKRDLNLFKTFVSGFHDNVNEKWVTIKIHQIVTNWLVVWNMNFLFFHFIYGIFLPIDELIFFKRVKTC